MSFWASWHDICTDPLKTCCSPLASPSTVVSLRIVRTPLSTVTWAMPAPIRPAPKMARVLGINRKQVTFLLQIVLSTPATVPNQKHALHRSRRGSEAILLARYLTVIQADQRSWFWGLCQLTKVLGQKKRCDAQQSKTNAKTKCTNDARKQHFTSDSAKYPAMGPSSTPVFTHWRDRENKKILIFLLFF